MRLLSIRPLNLVLLPLLVAGLLVSCSGGLSPQDYAELHCSNTLIEELGLGEAEDVEEFTNGELADQAERLAERLRELSPPEAFEAHHRANLIWTEGLASELRRLDPDAQFDVQTFFGALDRLPDVLSQSWLDLAPDNRELLLAAGCEPPGPF